MNTCSCGDACACVYMLVHYVRCGVYVIVTFTGFQVSQLPNLNFFVYVPPINKSPLYLYYSPGNVCILVVLWWHVVINYTDDHHSYTSFLSPQWGGLVVYNHNSSDQHVHVDMHQVMPTFITQLKKLLGLPELVKHCVCSRACICVCLSVCVCVRACVHACVSVCKAANKTQMLSIVVSTIIQYNSTV